MSKKYCSGKFGKQSSSVITYSTYGKNVLILIKSPSERVKERIMLTKQKNGTYKAYQTILEKKRGTRREKKEKRKPINEVGKTKKTENE